MLDISAEKFDATLKAELAKSFASNFQAFVKRSQGLQIYRDAMYNLCQSYLNHAIDKGEAKTISGEIFKTAVELIKHELTLTNGNINPPAQQQRPVAPSLEHLGKKNDGTAHTSSKTGATN